MNLFLLLVGVFQILVCRGKHQLDAIQLVYLTGTRIEIDGYDIGVWIASSKLFDHTFTDYVIREDTQKAVCRQYLVRRDGSAPAFLRSETILHRSDYR